MTVTLRPLKGDEIHLVQPLGRRAFDDLAARTGRPAEHSDPASEALFRAAHQHLFETDPEGCLGAFDTRGQLVGTALAYVRATTWVLSLLALDPDGQGQGTGSRLLRAALQTAPPGSVRMLHSSRDARAMRVYHRAGFTILPCVTASGSVNRSLLGDTSGVRDGDVGTDAERVGVAHLAQELALVLAHGGRFLVSNDGCALVGGTPRFAWTGVLTAGNPTSAQRLLRAALAEASTSGGKVYLEPMPAQLSWAVDVAVEARVELSLCGPMAVAGLPEPLSGPCLPAAILI